MLGSAKSFGFTIAQNSGDTSGDKGTKIIYTVGTNELSIIPGQSTDIHPLKATVKPVNGKLKLQVLFDKSSLEVFANDGKKVLMTYIFPQQNATKVSAFAEGGNVKAELLRMFDFAK